MEDYEFAEFSIMNLKPKAAAAYLFCLINRIPIFHILNYGQDCLTRTKLLEFRVEETFGLSFYKSIEYKERIMMEKTKSYYPKRIYYVPSEFFQEWVSFIKRISENSKKRPHRDIIDINNTSPQIYKEDLVRGWVIDLSRENYDLLKQNLVYFPHYLILKINEKELKGYFPQKNKFEIKIIRDIQNNKIRDKNYDLMNLLIPKEIKNDQMVDFIISQLNKDLEQIEIKSKISDLYDASRKIFLVLSQLAEVDKLGKIRPDVSVFNLEDYLNIKSEKNDHIFIKRVISFIKWAWGFDLNPYVNYSINSRVRDTISDMF